MKRARGVPWTSWLGVCQVQQRGTVRPISNVGHRFAWSCVGLRSDRRDIGLRGWAHVHPPTSIDGLGRCVGCRAFGAGFFPLVYPLETDVAPNQSVRVCQLRVQRMVVQALHPPHLLQQPGGFPTRLFCIRSLSGHRVSATLPLADHGDTGAVKADRSSGRMPRF